MNSKLKTQIQNAPKLAGCYIYRDINGDVLYIGKAKNLSNRVKSYFLNLGNHTIKIDKMIELIDSVEYVIADSDEEAFILETNLIRKYNPKYNTVKKDDKNYSWVFIDDSDDFPRIQILRELPKYKKGDIYGPYPTQLPIKRILRTLRKIFPYRTCTRIIHESNEKIESSNSKPCLYYHLGLCNAPCAAKEFKKDYRVNIKNIKKFFAGSREDVLKDLKDKMIKYAFEQNFEMAAKVRDQISDLVFITQNIDVKPETDELIFRKAKSEKYAIAIANLIDLIDDKRLNYKANFRIEGYDISNIQGTNPTGSMVVFTDGVADKKMYRHFAIKSKSTPDDFFMHGEMQKRRWLKYFDKESKDISFKKFPDIILIDGGKGQVSKVLKVLSELNVDVVVVGIAKREETLILPKEINGQYEYIEKKLQNGSQEKFLIQRIRDESHRFAVTYHRKLRGKLQTLSSLSKIEGVGEAIEGKLLKAFGSFDGIKNASEKDLLTIIKRKSTVKNLKKALSVG